MATFEPDFEIIKMDAEVTSYQEDFDGDAERPDAAAATQTQSANQTSGNSGS